MENRNIIIAVLIIVIVVLAAAIGAMLVPSLNAQKDSKIVITGNKTLHEGDDLSVKLTDLNRTPIGDGAVNVVVVDKDGEVVFNQSVNTDSKGKAKLDLGLGAGKYTVNATFAGNDNFTGNSTSKKITVKEVAVESEPVEEQVSQSQSSSESQSSQSSEYGSYINDEWVPMTESQYAERYPALYHMQALEEGKYDEYHPEMYEADREAGRI